jgi:nucleolar protein 56
VRNLLVFHLSLQLNLNADNPTPKFGEALRAQVEERLDFFETGKAPGKNADAIRKVLDQLGQDEDDEGSDGEVDADNAPLTKLEPESSKKDKKRKRKREAMDVDEEAEEEAEPVKKVKLSKEEKKALKKAKKEDKKKEGKESVCFDGPLYDFVVLLMSVY